MKKKERKKIRERKEERKKEGRISCLNNLVLVKFTEDSIVQPRERGMKKNRKKERNEGRETTKGQTLMISATN